MEKLKPGQKLAWIAWNQYPETSPESEGHYLITLRRDEAQVIVFYFIDKFPAGTIAWAHLPAPAKKQDI